MSPPNPASGVRSSFFTISGYKSIVILLLGGVFRLVLLVVDDDSSFMSMYCAAVFFVCVRCQCSQSYEGSLKHFIRVAGFEQSRVCVLVRVVLYLYRYKSWLSRYWLTRLLIALKAYKLKVPTKIERYCLRYLAGSSLLARRILISSPAASSPLPLLVFVLSRLTAINVSGSALNSVLCVGVVGFPVWWSPDRELFILKIFQKQSVHCDWH
jgi:hypothetical protein